MLKRALREASLHSKLITENEQCEDFVKCQAMEDANDLEESYLDTPRRKN